VLGLLSVETENSIVGTYQERMMTMAYSKELRDAMVAKMLPPNNQSITRISKHEGIPEATLRKSRDDARANGQAAPAADSSSDEWSTEDKFLIAVETAGMIDQTLQSIAARKACMTSNRLLEGCFHSSKCRSYPGSIPSQ